jgi:hypothetical protein
LIGFFCFCGGLRIFVLFVAARALSVAFAGGVSLLPP